MSTVEPLAIGAASEHRFSLMFLGRGDEPITQGSYPMRHPEIGPFELFIVPVGGAAVDQAYQAVFDSLP